MSTKILNQKGFSALETILIAVVLAGIVGASVYVWTSRQEAKTSNVEIPRAKSEKSNEIVIQELGIKMSLPDGLDGLKYEVADGQDSTVANFTTDSLERAAEGTKNPVGENGQLKVCSYGAIGSIGKANKVEEEGPYTVKSKKVGDFYVTLFSMPDGGPCSDSSSVASLASDQHDLLKSAFETIELSK